MRTQIIEQCLQCRARFGVRGKLPCQFGSCVFATRQQPAEELAALLRQQAGVRVPVKPAKARARKVPLMAAYSVTLIDFGEGTFTAVRILASISSAICGLALRYSRALSLP